MILRNCSTCLLIITSLTFIECEKNLKSTLQEMKKDAKEMGRLITDTDYTKVTKADRKNIRSSVEKIIEHLDILDEVVAKINNKKTRDRYALNNVRGLKKVTDAMGGTERSLSIAVEKEIKRSVKQAMEGELNVLSKLENQKRANLYTKDLLKARKIQIQAKKFLNTGKRSYTTWLAVA